MSDDDGEVYDDPLHQFTGRRPPIHSIDEPIDESDADVVDERRAERADMDDAIARMGYEKYWFIRRLQEMGFGFVPLDTDKKSPPVGVIKGKVTWAQAIAKTKILKTLGNPGTQNAAMTPPPGVVGLDIDKGAPELLRAKALELGPRPPTLTIITPNGAHLFYRWPKGLPRPHGDWWGQIVARWDFRTSAKGEGGGYTVAPGSYWDGLDSEGKPEAGKKPGPYSVYLTETGDDWTIAELPEAWARDVLNGGNPPLLPDGNPTGSGPLAEVRQHYELPEPGYAGSRYGAILAYTAHLYNRGFSEPEMWSLVQSELAPLFAEPLTVPQLRERFDRATEDIEQRLGPPMKVVGGSAGIDLTDGLFVRHDVLLAELLSREPSRWLVEDWVPGGSLCVWAGHPKSMKSLALLQLLGEFVAGGSWLGRTVVADVTRVGMYMTREGSNDEMAARIQRLEDRHGGALGSRLRVAYEKPIEFDEPSYRYVSGALAAVEAEMSEMLLPLRAILVIDPMRDFMSAGSDENEAKVMAVVKRWCRSLIAEYPWLSIVLVHHLRKSGSFDELDMAGSGATFGAVDGSVIWTSNGEASEEDEDEDGGRLVRLVEMSGKYKVKSRGIAAFKGQWHWDAATESIVRKTGKVVGASGRVVRGTGLRGVVEAVRGSGKAGMTTDEVYRAVEAETAAAKGTTRKQLSRAVLDEELETDGDRYYGHGMEPEEDGLGL